MAEWQIHRNGDTSAIYLDGALFDIGDSNTMRSQVLTSLGVVQVNDDAFMLGQDKRNKAAATLAAITAWKTQQATKRTRLQEIRASIAALKAEARSLGDEAV